MPVLVAATDLPGLVAERVRDRAGTRWVGIDGFGAAGKTTLAAAVAHALPGSVVVHVDDFARPSVQGWERDRFAEQVLAPLAASRSARYQRWDWDSDTGAEWHDIPPGVPVVVEGVSSTDVRLGVPWDVQVWVEASREVRLARALERDGESMMDQWLTDWMPSEERYAAAQRPRERSDFCVRTDPDLRR
ncbi:AAA family ATPase [Microlunatus lacustris]